MVFFRIAATAGLGFSLLGLALTAGAQERSVSPGINQHYEDPDYRQWVATFERPGREIYDRRHEIANVTGLSPGMVVADVGAGTGLFTRLFAPMVGNEGRVIAVDISRGFIENILRTSRQQGLVNVEGVVNTAADVSLPAASVDLVFVCDSYHHFEYPQRMLESIYEALRPGGELVVIDFRRIPGYSFPWVMQHVRAGKPTVVREIESAGFRLTEDRDFLRTNYFLRFQKPGA
jgi:ubiquinone/menaquinone biosynthesis C-methylase UbiE